MIFICLGLFLFPASGRGKVEGSRIPEAKNYNFNPGKPSDQIEKLTSEIEALRKENRQFLEYLDKKDALLQNRLEVRLKSLEDRVETLHLQIQILLRVFLAFTVILVLLILLLLLRSRRGPRGGTLRF